MSSGLVLIIDDDPAFVDLYTEVLEGEGHQVVVANSAQKAAEILDARGRELDVVLIDQKLQGPGGPDSGLELLARVRRVTPLAKAIIVTGYSSAEAVERAFREGVYDYLIKNGAFEALLKAKIRNAVESTLERRLRASTRDQREAELRAAWQGCMTESNRNRKGALLERVVKLLFASTPGFENVSTELRNDNEQLDIVIENRVKDGPWAKEQSAYFIGECKNWSSKADAAEARNFWSRFDVKNRRVRAGFFISLGGFTAGFEKTRLERSATDVVVVLVTKDDVQAWIDAPDRLLFLNQLHQRATLNR
ncbi:MAG: response regulator [Myxococcota bacterium]